ncbi:hypothetical protein [Thiosulfativibrio zosterae]|uniref:DUF4398 domain-containing protein n=1 Tax=Thiosulfativibrio zosterae TaxID=2675053 RepID=A0A6F8PQY0_9GAMM|nr:hypothetical protein [Thiosulfativibrio zosterae]BBP44533.1 hypothetical protein THMIRHAT_22790 [Thiosulfativibrio zosterae]
MNLTTRTLLALGLGLCLGSAQALSLKDSDTLDKLDALDRGDQQAVLNQAKQAAKDWKFDDAERLLKQAKVIAYNPAAVKEVEALIATNKQAKADKEEKERQLAAQRQREAEARRVASASSASSTGGGVDCDRLYGNYNLQGYCRTKDCSYLSNNSKVHYLCESCFDGSCAYAALYDGFDNKVMKNLAGFAAHGSLIYDEGISKDAVYSANTNHSSSFEARKQWIIYYLNNYTLK